jgi:Tfp pilus assembly protein PilN
MTYGTPLNLNLATRPLRNRRLYTAAVRVLAVLLVGLAGLAVFVVLKFGGEASRLKAANTETARVQSEAAREEKRLVADIGREEKLSRARVDLANLLIRRKMFSWTGLLTELEKALPGPSYITALTPSFTPQGAVALQMRVTSRSLDDLLVFLNALTAGGFKDVKAGGEQRSDDGRLVAEITATYERPL